jgi:hypothetical protein
MRRPDDIVVSQVRAPIYRQFAGPMQSRQPDRALAHSPCMGRFRFAAFSRGAFGLPERQSPRISLRAPMISGI